MWYLSHGQHQEPHGPPGEIGKGDHQEKDYLWDGGGMALPPADCVLGKGKIDGQRVRSLLEKMPARAWFLPSSNTSTTL